MKDKKNKEYYKYSLELPIRSQTDCEKSNKHKEQQSFTHLILQSDSLIGFQNYLTKLSYRMSELNENHTKSGQGIPSLSVFWIMCLKNLVEEFLSPVVKNNWRNARISESLLKNDLAVISLAFLYRKSYLCLSKVSKYGIWQNTYPQDWAFYRQTPNEYS